MLATSTEGSGVPAGAVTFFGGRIAAARDRGSGGISGAASGVTGVAGVNSAAYATAFSSETFRAAGFSAVAPAAAAGFSAALTTPAATAAQPP